MAKKKLKNILDLKITLKNVEPAIWRRVLVPDDFFLDDLHGVFQLAMGWEAMHLYSYKIGDSLYLKPDEEDGFGIDGARDVDIQLFDALGNKKKFLYTYDFGDGWDHEIEVMGKLEENPDLPYPLCMGGENACPPEDCGGPYGYENFLQAINDPKNESHHDMIMWVGGFFDPKGFDANIVNRLFRTPGDEAYTEQLLELL